LNVDFSGPRPKASMFNKACARGCEIRVPF